MNKFEFYKTVDEKTACLTLEQAKSIISNIVRKIPDEKNEEVLDIINNTLGIKTFFLDKKEGIDFYLDMFEKIKKEELYFTATYNEDYDDWYDLEEFQYHDPFHLKDFLQQVYDFAEFSINHMNYKDVKTVLDLFLNTTFFVKNEDYDDEYFDLQDLKCYDFIPFSIDQLFYMVIYATCKLTNGDVSIIYDYFKKRNYPILKLENIFTIGIETLENKEELYQKLIYKLLEHKGDLELMYLRDLKPYSNMDFEEIARLSVKNHPKLCYDYMTYLFQANKYSELISFGLEIKDNLEDNETRADIFVLLAYTIKNLNSMEDVSLYLYEALVSKKNIPDLLRLILTKNYDSYKNEIDSMFLNEENNLLKYCYYFFTGQFEILKHELENCTQFLGWSYSMKHIQITTKLFLNFMNQNEDITPNHKKLMDDILASIDFDEQEKFFLFENEPYEIFSKFKEICILSRDELLDILKLLDDMVEKRVNAILVGNYRKSYDKAAFLVAILGEDYQSLKVHAKIQILDHFKKEYPRRTAFHAELKKFTN